MNTPSVHVRVTDDLLNRAYRLVPHMQRLPETAIYGQMSMAKVCRMALSMGLDALEERYLPPEARGPAPDAPSRRPPKRR